MQHFCLLVGYGADAINPYLAFETLADMKEQGLLPADLTVEKAIYHFIKSVDKGMINTFAKMGISTLQSYKGAQIFEAIGLDQELVDRYFTGTPSRLGGVKLDVLRREAVSRHARSPIRRCIFPKTWILEPGGQYQWRRFGEHHHYNPDTVAKLQHAVRANDYQSFKAFSSGCERCEREPLNLARLRQFVPGTSRTDRRGRAGTARSSSGL